MTRTWSDEQIETLGFQQDMMEVRLRLSNQQMTLGDGFTLRDGVMRLAETLSNQPSISRDEFREAFREYFK